jgi:Fe-Mn family superoxide dismutase
MQKLSRRIALGAIGISGISMAAENAMATPRTNAVLAPPFAGLHIPKPLPFNPASLRGISERLIVSHHDNNYVGAVNALNSVEKRLAESMQVADFPVAIYGALKREELIRTGSLVLHELYFQNLGGNGRRDGAIETALASAYGSSSAWEAEFRRTGMALAGGTGWCILAYNIHTKSLHNYWCLDHTNQSAMSVPLLVMDMYEHAFQMDYGAAAARYVEAFFQNINWDVVNARLSIAQSIG